MLYFGSFNPIHVGHVALAECALEASGADELWFVLSPQNPLKASEGLWNDELRLRLARAAVVDGRMRVSDVELGMPKPNYTYMTLRYLRERYVGWRFSLLIGADNYVIFDRWRHYEEILAWHDVYVYPREGCVADRSVFPQMRWIDAPLFPVSATEVREKMARGERITGLVPEGVEKIIESMR